MVLHWTVDICRNHIEDCWILALYVGLFDVCLTSQLGITIHFVLICTLLYMLCGLCYCACRWVLKQFTHLTILGISLPYTMLLPDRAPFAHDYRILGTLMQYPCVQHQPYGILKSTLAEFDVKLPSSIFRRL